MLHVVKRKAADVATSKLFLSAVDVSTSKGVAIVYTSALLYLSPLQRQQLHLSTMQQVT